MRSRRREFRHTERLPPSSASLGPDTIRGDEEMPFTGQSAGLVHDILPAREIVTRMLREAEEALRRVDGFR